MKSYLKILLTLSFTILSLCACGKEPESADSTVTAWEKIEEAPASMETPAEPAAASQNDAEPAATSQNTTEAPAVQERPAEAPAAFSYAELSGIEFVFSSGAGGWSTYFTVNADGTFSGNYHDSEMGDAGDAYPNGTLYYSDFTGRFGTPVKVDENTYKTTLEAIDYADTPETEEIRDGIRYLYSTAYGLGNPADLYFYLPGKPVSELPGPFLSWVPAAEDAAKDGRITVYGFYNENMEYGFGAFPSAGEVPASGAAASGGSESAPDAGKSVLNAEQLKEQVEQTKVQSDELENRLEHEDMSQTEMNLLSAELYEMWDDTINTVWSTLQNTLPEDEMRRLTDDQLGWIRSKEEQVVTAGAQYEGGSIRPLIENRLAAELTRDRVYELLTYLN